ncbi:MAG: hypothetical protein HY748_14450 [Elusimicrobia bacterium]|nr:hypothetical protein [Elusimicrobiota bacterium]
MEHCKYCGCIGLFFGLDKSGLCASCRHMASLEIGLRSAAVREASRKVETTLNPQSKIAGLDIVVENLQALTKYEERGIPTIEGSPAAMLEEARREQVELILETARSERGELLAQAEKVQDFEAKRRLYAGFLLRIAEYRSKLDDPAPLDELQRQVHRVVHQVQLDAVVRLAMESESAGRKEEAVKRYREAVEFLKKADVDSDFRTSQMLKLNAKVKKLAGKASKPGAAGAT